MKLNKQILEAVRRGILLALDDYEDIETSNSISHNNDIIDSDDVIQTEIDFWDLWVDLGLPSGTLWAKTNIGAQSETEAGLYFAWGEIAQHEGWLTDKSTHPYNWSEYQYAKSDYNELKKYCNNPEYGYKGFTDSLTELESVDDIATVVLGAGYKMPTKVQFEELIDETDNEWTSINGVNGWKFTNKLDSSKYIFLPAAGYCYDSNLYRVGNEGNYWSFSLNEDYPNIAWSLCFNNEVVNMYYNYRCGGLTVRPVRTAN